jgi:hypothetical protein
MFVPESAAKSQYVPAHLTHGMRAANAKRNQHFWRSGAQAQKNAKSCICKGKCD